jgi:membrane-associated phospholipid phosphatase
MALTPASARASLRHPLAQLAGKPRQQHRVSAAVLWLALFLCCAPAAAQDAPPTLLLRTGPAWSSAAPAVLAPGPVSAGTPALDWAVRPTLADVRAEANEPRGLIPPGLLRYRVPDDARPFAIPYAVVGVTLLAADPYVLRALKLDSLYIRDDGSPPHHAHIIYRTFSHLGDPPAVAAMLAGLYALGGSRERDAARVGGVAYFNAISLTAVGKYLTGKERPYVSGGRLRYHGPNRRYASFPSGHSSGTSSVAHVLAHYYPDTRLLWYGLSGMAGISRIGLARHWPSDVWWGWGVGVLGAEGALRERERIEAWRPW